MSDLELNDRQRKFVEAVARGKTTQDAARSAGYAPGYCRKASRLLKQPLIAKAIAEIRTEGRKLAAYGLVEAMNEAESAATFARINKNSMALVKAYELRAKLSGLLVDHVVMATVDLTGALARAESRVLASTPPTPQARGSIDWKPLIPGNSAAGPADDKPVSQDGRNGQANRP